MKTGWHENKLGEVCSFLGRGISPKYIDEGGICVLNQKCIRDHAINFDPSRRHDSVLKNVSAERSIQVGDVLVNSTGVGTLGRVAQVRDEPPEQTTVDSHVTIVRPEPGLFHLDFFGYMLVAIEEQIKVAGEGCGGQTELARTLLADGFNVNYPASLDEQKRIVAILDEAFEAIDKAKQNAEKNLQNARELFESYLQNIFTNPGEGWKQKNLDDLVDEKCTLSYGIVQPGEDYPKGLPVIRPTDLTRRFIDLTGLKQIDPKLAEGYKRTKLIGDELLICVRGRTGVVSIASAELKGANVTRGIVPIRFNPQMID